MCDGNDKKVIINGIKLIQRSAEFIGNACLICDLFESDYATCGMTTCLQENCYYIKYNGRDE